MIMDLTGLSFGILQMFESLPAAVVSMREMRDSGRREVLETATQPDMRPEAMAVYLAFEAAATEYILALDLIARLGVPPKVAGALWSWPSVFRAHRTLQDAVATMTASFGQMIILGSSEVTAAAYDFALRLAEVGPTLQVARRRLVGNPTFDVKHGEALVALRAYLLAVRRELSREPDTVESRASAQRESG